MIIRFVRFSSSRIRIYSLEHDYIKTLNVGMSLAQGKYIARMDADDLMFPERLQIQYTILEQYTHITVCSTWMETFGNGFANKLVGTLFGEIDDPLLLMLHGNFISNPTTMIRNSFFKGQQLQYKILAVTQV